MWKTHHECKSFPNGNSMGFRYIYVNQPQGVFFCFIDGTMQTKYTSNRNIMENVLYRIHLAEKTHRAYVWFRVSIGPSCKVISSQRYPYKRRCRVYSWTDEHQSTYFNGVDHLMSGWWLEHFFCSPIVGMLIQSDFHIFQVGRSTTNQMWIYDYLPSGYLT